MKKTTRIPIHTLIAWLDDAEERYARKENDPANRVLDAIKLDLIHYLHGKDCQTDYMFTQVDRAIDALRRTDKQVAADGQR